MIKKLQLVLVAAILFSCGDDDDVKKASGPGTKTITYEFTQSSDCDKKMTVAYLDGTKYISNTVSALTVTYTQELEAGANGEVILTNFSQCKTSCTVSVKEEGTEIAKIQTVIDPGLNANKLFKVN